MIGIQFDSWVHYNRSLEYYKSMAYFRVTNYKYPQWNENPVIIYIGGLKELRAMSLQDAIRSYGEGQIEWLDTDEFHDDFIKPIYKKILDN